MGLLFLWALGLLFLVFWTDRSMVYSKSCPLAWCIPAWAGEPSPSVPDHPAASVYPRVGGGTFAIRFGSSGSIGLSPRGRGNLRHPFRIIRQHRSIPAWAGEPIAYSADTRRIRVYPRVGGGTDTMLPPGANADGLSPRGRGNLIGAVVSATCYGSIPAWAGEPGRMTLPDSALTVYPRVGGGTIHTPGFRTEHPMGSIPAWAGEPQGPAAAPGPFLVYPRVGGGTVEPLLSGFAP